MLTKIGLSAGAGITESQILPQCLGQFCTVKIGLKIAYAKENLLFLSHVHIFGLLQCSGFLVSGG